MRPHSNDAPGRRTNARRARGPDRRDPRSEEHTSELQSRLHLVSLDRKSTRLNSSHGYISYAVFCLKKKKKLHKPPVLLPCLALKNTTTTGCSETVRHIEHDASAAISTL